MNESGWPKNIKGRARLHGDTAPVLPNSSRLSPSLISLTCMVRRENGAGKPHHSDVLVLEYSKGRSSLKLGTAQPGAAGLLYALPSAPLLGSQLSGITSAPPLLLLFL